MSVTFGVSNGVSGREEMHDTEVIVQFVSVIRDEDGQMHRRHAPKYGYEERDGTLYKRDTTIPIPAAQAATLYEDRIHLSFRVVSPAGYYGEILRYECNMKGVNIVGADGVYFPSGEDRLSGLIATCDACGFSRKKVDGGSPLFDAAFVEKYADGLSTPVTVEDVLLRFLEPILYDAAEAGHLVSARTRPNSDWLKTYSFKALSPAEADAIWATVKEPEEETATVPEGADRAVLKGKVIAAAQAGKVTTQGIMDYLKSAGMQYDPEAASILDTLSVEDLQKVVAWVGDDGPSL